MLSKIGLNVDYISTDWGTVVQRIQRKQSIAEGGWSIFGLMWGGYDWYSPAADVMLRGRIFRTEPLSAMISSTSRMS
jgi:peptide/nickel transport system substrate-binding protein